MERVKSPKSLAYARLGKPQLGMTSVRNQQNKSKRNSTGNIYQQILQQIHPEANSYIRNLVGKNQKQASLAVIDENIDSRRKSYAQIMIQSLSKDKQPKNQFREERETLCKPKQNPDTRFLKDHHLEKNRNTPTNCRVPVSKQPTVSSQQNKNMMNSFKSRTKTSQETFLSNLTNYLEQLKQIPHKQTKMISHDVQNLSQTLKINSGGQHSVKLFAKLEQSQLKVKQLKLLNSYQQKQLKKRAKKQRKMKESLFEMLAQIKKLTYQLNYEKSQRKNLEKIINNFELRKNHHERKTIEKGYVRLEEYESECWSESDIDYDQDSSFQEYFKNATQNKRSCFNSIKMCDSRKNVLHSVLDSQKISKLFKSNSNTDESED